jgi:FkbM family methyltransferase
LSAVRSFADLGCNRGFFSLWLAANTSPNLDGILVEANPHLITLIDQLLRKNNLQQFHVRNGVVGAGPDERECEILIPPTDVGAGLASTTRDSLAGDVCETVRVPALDFAKLWSETFPDGRSCDLLKIDIEGAEARFFDDEAEFLSRVRQLVVEVHKRMVPLDEFRETLRRRGFKIVHERSDDSETSLIFAKNNSA